VPRQKPTTLTSCAALVGLEAVGLLAAAVFYVVELVVATEDDAVRALVSAGLALVAAVGLALVARGLRAGRRWARSPALVANLLVVPVAVGLLQGGRWYVGLPLLALAVAVLVLLFHPSTSIDLDEE
jgi:NADH:ubiquinone oxidoreductase subunit K